MDSTLKQINFQTSASLGTSQNNSVGSALANLINSTIKTVDTINTVDEEAKRKELAKKKLEKEQADNRDYSLYLDYNARISEKQKEMSYRELNPDEAMIELDDYMSKFTTDFIGEDYNNRFISKKNEVLEKYSGARTKYLEDNFVSKVENAVSNVDYARGIENLEEFFTKNVSGNLTNKTNPEVKKKVYSKYIDTINGFLLENKDRIIEQGSSTNKVLKTEDFMTSYIETLFPAYKGIQDSSLRGKVESVMNTINDELKEKRIYKNTVTTIDRFIDEGNSRGIVTLINSTDEDSAKDIKGIVQKELNNTDLVNNDELEKALKMSSVLNMKIQPLEDMLTGLTTGTINDEDAQVALDYWQRSRNLGYRTNSDVREKLETIEALETLYGNNINRAYNVFRDGYVSEKMTLQSINEKIKENNFIVGLFSSDGVKKYTDISNDSFSNQLATKLQKVLRYTGDLSDESIKRIGNKLSEQMLKDSVEYDGNILTGFNFSNAQEKFDYFIAGQEKDGNRDFEITPLRYTAGEGQQFMLGYSDGVNQKHKVINASEIEKYYNDKHKNVIKSEDTINGSTYDNSIKLTKSLSQKLNDELNEKFNSNNYVTKAREEALMLSSTMSFEEVQNHFDSLYGKQGSKEEKEYFAEYEKQVEADLENIYNGTGSNIVKASREATNTNENTRIDANQYLKNLTNKLDKTYKDFSAQDKPLAYGLDTDVIGGAIIGRVLSPVAKYFAGKIKGIRLDKFDNDAVTKIAKEIDEIAKVSKFKKNLSKKELDNLNLTLKNKADGLIKSIDESIEKVYSKKIDSISKKTGFKMKTKEDIAEVENYLEVYKILLNNRFTLDTNPKLLESIVYVHGNKIGLKPTDNMATKLAGISEFFKVASKKVGIRYEKELDDIIDELNSIRINSTRN